ncbi:hypothetical protein CDAR_490371 [Caerostris darwini]|uniref:Uncharacterized protein n=1 Tax=Caerostris darwini TaxID=1538125 RepID=A0AAV4R4I5_9ARAC|nr:hypothetical protein CDAR_490371 [Caerostris darwini]
MDTFHNPNFQSLIFFLRPLLYRENRIISHIALSFSSTSLPTPISPTDHSFLNCNHANSSPSSPKSPFCEPTRNLAKATGVSRNERAPRITPHLVR